MQLTLPVNINPKLMFENFIQTGNEYLIQNLLNMAKTSGETLYIYGENYGKTHLLNAFVNKFIATKNIAYIDIRKHNLELLEQVLEHIDILLLDNLDCANQQEQKIIFDLYNRSKDNFNLIITGTKSISNQDILIDLKTRMSQALNIKISGLNDIQIIDALMLKAKGKNLNFNIDIIKYLQKTYSRDLKKLVQMLEKLSDEALKNKQKISKNLVNKVYAKTSLKH